MSVQGLKTRWRGWGGCLTMKRLILIVLLSLIAPSLAISAEGTPNHLFLCRSPLLAFEFWRSLQNLRQQGLAVTPEIAQQICDGMRAGPDPQCIRVEADEFKPVASGWGGALAMADGKTKVWFHNPDSGGWVHPDYYVDYVNSKSPTAAGQ